MSLALSAILPMAPATVADAPQPTAAPLERAPAPVAPDPVPTVADLITLASYGLGLWWAFGGPTWAGLASIAGDEIDGRVARAMGQTSPRGSALDWGQDVSLTAAALYRLGIETDHVAIALSAAPPILYAQASLRAEDWRPSFGSARAAIMLAAMAAKAAK